LHKNIKENHLLGTYSGEVSLVALIIRREEIAPKVHNLVLEAPLIAKKALPGQFVILRVDEFGERIPLTIAYSLPEAGLIAIIVQEIGVTTMKIGRLSAGDEILDLVGPLGVPSEIELFGTVVCVGGGVGIAALYPIAKALQDKGNEVISILGARSDEFIIMRQEMEAGTSKCLYSTDDGSCGKKGFVSDVLKDLIDSGEKIDRVIAVGPAVMMRAVAETTRPYGIPTIASLNPIMVDGTGMCGACRVAVGGEIKFACVDGPDFDAHQVDWNQLLLRQRSFCTQEHQALEHYCGGERHGR